MSSHLSAIELLNLGDQDRTKPFLNVYWPYIVGSSLGLASGMFLNFSTRRPIFSGIQKHILAMAGWSTVLHFVQERRDNYYAEKDAMMRHYIELHPEDFPMPEKKKIGDILEPWIPVR